MGQGRVFINSPSGENWTVPQRIMNVEQVILDRGIPATNTAVAFKPKLNIKPLSLKPAMVRRTTTGFGIKHTAICRTLPGIQVIHGINTWQTYAITTCLFSSKNLISIDNAVYSLTQFHETI